MANLLSAWKEIARDVPEMSLALIGPTQPLGRFAREAGAPRVVVAGYMTHEEMPSVLKASVGLVCPSIYEGFGLPPLEGMALGIPVIGVNSSAVAEVTAHQAILAENGSPEALAAAMRELVVDPLAASARFRLPAIERARSFDWTKNAEELMAVYRNVLDED